MPSREELRARIAARKERVAARRARIQARRESRQAKAEELGEAIGRGIEAVARRERGLRRIERVKARREARREARARGIEPIEFETVAAERPPKETALTIVAENIEFLETTYVTSSWVNAVHLVRDLTTGRVRLAVTFKKNWTGIYTTTNKSHYHAIVAAESKGKHVWANLYRLPYRTITAATKQHLREPGMARGHVTVSG